MAECRVHENDYLSEASLPKCLKDQSLLRAYRKASAEFVNVSGGLETGGGVAIDRSLLPHVAIEENETLVLTAAHIVAERKPTLVGTYDGKGQLQDLYRGKVLFADKAADLALIKVNIGDRKQKPQSINYYDLRQAQVGETAIAFRPEDEERSIGLFKVKSNETYGALGGAAIRKRNPEIVVSDKTQVTLLDRLDLDGTSGSALVGGDGKILGIVSQRSNAIACGKETRIRQQFSCSGTVVISALAIRKFLEQADKELPAK